MRWVVTREQVASAFSMPLDWPDGNTVFIRMQFREKGMAGDAVWLEIPVISLVPDAPRIQLVRPGAH